VKGWDGGQGLDQRVRPLLVGGKPGYGTDLDGRSPLSSARQRMANEPWTGRLARDHGKPVGNRIVDFFLQLLLQGDVGPETRTSGKYLEHARQGKGQFYYTEEDSSKRTCGPGAHGAGAAGSNGLKETEDRSQKQEGRKASHSVFGILVCGLRFYDREFHVPDTTRTCLKTFTGHGSWCPGGLLTVFFGRAPVFEPPGGPRRPPPDSRGRRTPSSSCPAHGRHGRLEYRHLFR